MAQLELDVGAQILPLRSKKRRERHAAPRQPCVITVFPILRRTNINKEIARGLDARSGDERENFWAGACTELAYHLRRAGQPENAVEGHLHLLQIAVQRELDRSDPTDERREGGPK